MKIGLLYICTGPYIEFFEDFFFSSERFFLPETEKHYYIFTDGYNSIFKDTSKITVIPQHQLYWPYAVLYKFHYFLQAQHLIQKMDYLIMTNANIKFVSQISKTEILPSKEENYIFGTIAPWLYKTGKLKLTEDIFENNPLSKAYIKKEKRKKYYAAGFCGGRTNEFLKMSYQIRNWIEQDLSKNIFAKWEDQAYLNKYFSEIKIKELNPSYCYPEEYEIPFSKKIIVIYKQGLKNDPLKRTYRKYLWDKKTSPPKNIFQKIRKYSIYYLIKFLKKFE